MDTIKYKIQGEETGFRTRIFCRKTNLNKPNSGAQQAKLNKNTNNCRKPTKSVTILDTDVPKTEILKFNFHRTFNNSGISSSKWKDQPSSRKEVSKKSEPRPQNMNRASGFRQRRPNQSYANTVRNGGAQKHQQRCVKNTTAKLSNPQPGQQGKKTKKNGVVSSTIPDVTEVVTKKSPSIRPTIFQQEIMSPGTMKNIFPFSRIIKEPFYPERQVKNDKKGSPLDSMHELKSILDTSSAPTNLKEEETLLSEDYKRVFGEKDCIDKNFAKPLALTTDGALEIFSRKVFVGGLSPELTEEEIVRTLQRFGPMIVDWPKRVKGKYYRYRFLFVFFQEESSVQRLVEACIKDFGKYFLRVSKTNGEFVIVQINPWCLSNMLFEQCATTPIDPRKTALVGGVPRTMKAVELACIMSRLYGAVSCVRIDVDEVYQYPRGIAFVSFYNQESYICALSARYIQIQTDRFEKRIEVKHCVVDNQLCDICKGELCEGKEAPFFCASLTCLKYYCRECWASNHSQSGGDLHKPLVKEGLGPQLIPWRLQFAPRS